MNYQKLYQLFNKFDNPADFSSYLTLNFAPIVNDRFDDYRLIYVKYGDLLKHTLFYLYQFYKIYDMSIFETLSSMQFEIDNNPAYNKKRHEYDICILIEVLTFFIEKDLIDV